MTRLHNALRAVAGFSPGDSVSYIGTSDTRFIQDTSITETIPSDTQSGDLLIASVMHRDTLTPPSGWELFYSLDVSGDFDQWLSTYTKTADSSDAGSDSTWTQATSDRFSLNISAFRQAYIDLFSFRTGKDDDGIIDIPEDAINDTEISVTSATSVYASTDSTNTFEASSGWDQITPASSTDTDDQIRMGLAYQEGPGTYDGEWNLNVSADREEAAATHITLTPTEPDANPSFKGIESKSDSAETFVGNLRTGWEFRAKRTISVNTLYAMTEQSEDQLVYLHRKDDETLVAEGTVTTTPGEWASVSITEVTLDVGVTYIISARSQTNNDENFERNEATVVYSDYLDYIVGVFNDTTDTEMPDTESSNTYAHVDFGYE